MSSISQTGSNILPMADSIILVASARNFDATLWTQDADFEGIAGVHHKPK
jgi:predicted nuclease of predicted toxin-antitoxin system